jgi:ABC-type Zn uptake system ZnuABC Zn-binding protein ZnuA
VKRDRWSTVLLAWAISFAGMANAQNNSEVLVLTGLPATYAITRALADGTHVRVANVPAEGRPMSAQARYFEKPGKEAAELLRAADAVVSIRKLWREDPLFASARAQNIRVVDIDATEPFSATMPGIALVKEPEGRAPWEKAAGRDATSNRASPYFWLGLSSSARAAEIVAQDLARLAPQDAERIARNLETFRRRLFDLKQSYEAKLANLDNVTVFALSGDFVYFTADLDVFVEGYFLKQDIEWTPADLDAFGKHLTSRGIRVVIHKWEPSEAIQQAVKAAGAKLVVLRTGETFGTQEPRQSPEASYEADLQANLAALYSALKP